MATKSTFNEKQVRRTFKSYVCGEFMLPSGKPSGYYKFPIADEEINEYMQYYTEEDKPKKFLTWSEWALWSSLRMKYGLNYLKPKKQTFLSHIDAMYEPPKIDNNLEEKLLFYIDNKLEEVLELACAKAQPAQDTEDSKKNFRSALDNSDSDVLY